MRRMIALGALAVLLVAPACGDDDEEALSRDEFITQANSICREGDANIDEAAERVFSSEEQPSGEQIKSFFEDTVAPEGERRLEELRDLTPPEELEDGYNEFLDEFDNALEELKDQVEDDPEAIIESEDDPFETANDKANDLGLGECGDESDDSGDDSNSGGEEGTTPEEGE